MESRSSQHAAHLYIHTIASIYTKAVDIELSANTYTLRKARRAVQCGKGNVL